MKFNSLITSKNDSQNGNRFLVGDRTRWELALIYMEHPFFGESGWWYRDYFSERQ